MPRRYARAEAEPRFDSPLEMDENGAMTPGDAPGAREEYRVAH